MLGGEYRPPFKLFPKRNKFRKPAKPPVSITETLLLWAVWMWEHPLQTAIAALFCATVVPGFIWLLLQQ